ncbi:MAG: hypothetical protein BGP24_02030 [Lysobacterales bacterium 69-70]|nr:hypothetical protein [Xanthomonadaceae bacterium]ODU31827.1 MAG: hypothetical protein ABS97_16300 [Xanthomonadaceae bacterium SCN 69-320]ODV18844.1 MAG: hypothetical protein ABT27_12610 [Xanthomonadaceae bacterium SCN 69-25]OJZ01551.1 MAG: hypothetical protein BGP24_02030 [Xanthomonadales bacterium 69-70]
MDQSLLMQLASYVMPLLIIGAVTVLLGKTGSPWLVAALAFEVLMLLCRLAMHFGASSLLGSPLFMAVWNLFGLLFGVCLLGFAVTWQPSARRNSP